VEAAASADATVLFLGLSPRLENEDLDRADLELPAMQQQLLERVVATGKPVVLVLLSGGPLAVNWAKQHVPAIVQAWYPGQAGGTAIADVLFGDYNPSGRLPVTFYKSSGDLPAFEDYSMTNRTYRFFSGDVLYPFGHGLSYTTFSESPSVPSRDGVTVRVTNTGDRAGEHTVMLFGKPPDPALSAFGKVYLAPGESKSITLAPYHRTSQ
jgi:beta-glucosidase